MLLLLFHHFLTNFWRIYCHRHYWPQCWLKWIEQYHQISCTYVHPIVVAECQTFCDLDMLPLNDISIILPQFFLFFLFILDIRVRVTLLIIVLHPFSQISIVAFWFFLCLHLIFIVKILKLLVFFGCLNLPPILVDIAHQLKSIVSHHAAKSLVDFDFWYFARDFHETRVVGDTLESLVFRLLRFCSLGGSDFISCLQF